MCWLQASILARCPITVQTTWSGDVWLLRQEFLPWAQYHAAVGVSRIMVMYDGKDAKALAWLKAMPRVSVLTVVPEFASAEEKADWDNYRKVNGDASSDEWKNRPGNYEVMVKQGEQMAGEGGGGAHTTAALGVCAHRGLAPSRLPTSHQAGIIVICYAIGRRPLTAVYPPPTLPSLSKPVRSFWTFACRLCHHHCPAAAACGPGQGHTGGASSWAGGPLPWLAGAHRPR